MTRPETRTIRTDVPSRLDRLQWARWHWLVLVGLGTSGSSTLPIVPGSRAVCSPVLRTGG